MAAALPRSCPRCVPGRDHVRVWNCAQHSKPHPGKMQGAGLRHQWPVRHKGLHGNQTLPPERGSLALVFQALGGQLEPTSWRNWGADQRLTALESQAPQTPPGKLWKGGQSLGAHLRLPGVLGWLLKPGALRRSQPCVRRAVSCGMAEGRDSGSGSRMQARNPERCVPRWRKEDRNPGLL